VGEGNEEEEEDGAVRITKTSQVSEVLTALTMGVLSSGL
jgi:hypothetical protein